MQPNKIIQFQDLLFSIQNRKGSKFNGLGLVLYKDLSSIPIVPMRASIETAKLLKAQSDLVSFLIEISSEGSAFHDGFHFVNENFTITHLSQFISPPITDTLISNKYGSRFITATLTSKINGVIATGVVSKDYGPFVFVNGAKLNV